MKNEKSLHSLTDINLKADTELMLDSIEIQIFDQMILNSYIRGFEIVEVTKASITIALISAEALAVVDKSYRYVFEKATQEIYGVDLAVKFTIRGERLTINKTNKHINVHEKYVLDRYVESSFNKETLKITKQIIENPGRYSPFFVTSKSGLGKTHLLHAIGVEFNKKGVICDFIEPGAFTTKITAFSREGGTAISDYIDSLKKNEVLIFDDIQSLGDRNVTLNVLLELLNHFIDFGKQVIVASDRLPKELSGFESRFITRFSGGITSTIKEPSQEDLVNVLKGKLVWSGMDINTWDDEALSFVARNNSTSIRSIEQAINRINLYLQDFKITKYTLKIMESIFRDIQIDPIEITPQRIIQTTAAYYRISSKELIGKSRQKKFAFPRHVTVWLIRQTLPDLSLTNIGKLFSGRDHTTIMSSIKKIDDDMLVDKNLRNSIDSLKRKIQTAS